MSLESVFFDPVGTLTTPRPSVGAFYARVASRLGIAADPSALQCGFAVAWRERAHAPFGPLPDYLTDDRREKDWWRQTVALTFRSRGEVQGFLSRTISPSARPSRISVFFSPLLPVLTSLF